MLAAQGRGLINGRQRMPAAEPIEVQDMAIVRRTFGSGYSEAGQLMSAVQAPSTARVIFLADHIDSGITVLHIHNQSEDELLCLKLIERVPEQAPVTGHRANKLVSAEQPGSGRSAAVLR